MMDENTPDFHDLYILMRDYLGYSLYWEVLVPWLPKAQQALAELQPYRKRNTLAHPYAVDDGDLWQWYALNRVNDYLLARFQHEDVFLKTKQRPSSEWRSWMSTVGYRYLVEGYVSMIHPAEYTDFFTNLGFTLVADRPFHPFLHEIVEVVEEAEMDVGEVLVEHVFWPGLMFGNMLFSRAGVRVWCHPNTLNKQVAENSTLYFTFWRQHRRTEDLSHGWGSGSQWGTAFRRDYEEEGSFLFNVDGKYPLGEEYEKTLSDYERKHQNDLTIEERIELLTNRCFVTCAKDDGGRWPYDDTYSVSKHKD